MKYIAVLCFSIESKMINLKRTIVLSNRKFFMKSLSKSLRVLADLVKHIVCVDDG